MTHSEQISDFLAFLRETKLENSVAVSQERDAGDQTQDILHSLELDNNRYHECAKLSMALREARRERRKAKDRAQITQPIVDWERQNQKTIRELERLLGEVRRAEKATEGRSYNPKTDIVKHTPGGD